MKKAISLLIILTCFLAFQRPVAAQSEFMDDNAAETALNAPSNLGKFSDETINRSAATLLRSLVGDEVLAQGKNTVPYAYRPSTYYGKGIVPSMIEYTAYLMNRPIKSSEYIADVLHNTGIVKQAYAQGVGFAGLTPVLNIWKAFRNLTYFLFIIVFVVIGFMIMFRKKVGSNTIVTIQEALPKLIVTLLLITFSYAIAGLVIDVMYLSIFIIMALFDSSGLITGSQQAINTLFSRNIIGLGIKYFSGIGEPAGVAAEAMGQLISQALGGFLGTMGNAVFYLIFVVAIVIAVFRTFIQLVTAYVGIILSTILAPIQLLPNAFPGNEAFGKWFKGLIANAAVFPVTCAILILGASITGRNNDSNNDLSSLISPDRGAGYQYSGFIPPLIYSQSVSDSNNNTGGSSGGSVNAIRAIIGFGMLMLLPEIVKLVKEALQVKDQYGELATKNAGSGWGVVKAPVSIPGSLALGYAKNQLIMNGRQGFTNIKSQFQAKDVKDKNKPNNPPTVAPETPAQGGGPSPLSPGGGAGGSPIPRNDD